MAAVLNPTGTGVLFSTVIGGQGDDNVAGLARDSAGNLYLVGSTSDPPEYLTAPPSYDFPVTSDAMQSAFGPGFVLKLSADASLLEYSTFLGDAPTTLDNSLWLTPLGAQLGSDGKLRMLMYSERSDLPLTPDSYDPCYSRNDYTQPQRGENYMYARFSSDLETIEYATTFHSPGRSSLFRTV